MKWLLWGIPALALVGLVVWRFSIRGGPTGAAKAGAGKKMAAVEVAKATSREMVETIQSVGSVESPFKVEVSPRTSGRISYLQAREGDAVTPGEVLLKIDPSDLQGAVVQQQAAIAEARSRLAQAQLTSGATDVGVASQIRQQNANLVGARADYDQVQKNYQATLAAAQAQIDAATQAVIGAKNTLAKEIATLQNMQARYNRTLGLYTSGFTAAQDLDDAKTAVQVQIGAVGVAQGQVSSAQSLLKVQQQNLIIARRKGQSDIADSKAKLAVAQASVDVARANRSQSPAYRENIAALRSQVDASIAQLRQAQARLQDTVVRSSIAGSVTARKADPGVVATPGTPVLEVQFLDWLYVAATVPISASGQIHQGQTARINIESLPGRTFTGPITNINAAADPVNRQFGIKVRLENRDRLVRPGMYGTVSVTTRSINARVVVPKEAVVRSEQDGTSTVTVVDQNKVANVRPVSLGLSDNRGVQITKGVEPGEQVVVLAYSPVKDGQKVSLGGAQAVRKKGSKRAKLTPPVPGPA